MASTQLRCPTSHFCIKNLNIHGASYLVEFTIKHLFSHLFFKRRLRNTKWSRVQSLQASRCKEDCTRILWVSTIWSFLLVYILSLIRGVSFICLNPFPCHMWENFLVIGLATLAGIASYGAFFLDKYLMALFAGLLFHIMAMSLCAVIFLLSSNKSLPNQTAPITSQWLGVELREHCSPLCSGKQNMLSENWICGH